LENYCNSSPSHSEFDSEKKPSIDRAKIRESIQAFRAEREKLGGPVVEKKVIKASED
jgi:hypothetical protein